MGVGAPRTPPQSPAQHLPHQGPGHRGVCEAETWGAHRSARAAQVSGAGLPGKDWGLLLLPPRHTRPLVAGLQALSSVGAGGGRPPPDPSPSRTPPEAGSLRRPGRTKARTTSWETWCCGCRCVGWGRRPRETVRRGVMRGSGEGFRIHVEQSSGSASIAPLPTRPACRPSGPSLPGGSVVPSGALHRDLPRPWPVPPPVPAHPQAGRSGTTARGLLAPSRVGWAAPGAGCSAHSCAGPVAESH